MNWMLKKLSLSVFLIAIDAFAWESNVAYQVIVAGKVQLCNAKVTIGGAQQSLSNNDNDLQIKVDGEFRFFEEKVNGASVYFSPKKWELTCEEPPKLKTLTEHLFLSSKTPRIKITPLKQPSTVFIMKSLQFWCDYWACKQEPSRGASNCKPRFLGLYSKCEIYRKDIDKIYEKEVENINFKMDLVEGQVSKIKVNDGDGDYEIFYEYELKLENVEDLFIYKEGFNVLNLKVDKMILKFTITCERLDESEFHKLKEEQMRRYRSFSNSTP